MNIYILSGHPDRDSLSGHIAESYHRAAIEKGHQVRIQHLGDMTFDPVLHRGYKAIQALEPDLIQAQENIRWCSHWVIVYPMWWGSLPALLKGFLDRALHPGFAFKYHDKGPGWDKLLKGRSAEIIPTSDAPCFWLRLAYHSSDFRTLRNATLSFCGFSPVKARRITRVKYKTPERLQNQVFSITKKIPKA